MNRGPDTFGPHGIQAKKDATLDSRMTPIVIRYLNDWYAAGLDLFNWFNYYATDYNTQYGTWGVTNDMFLKSSPKLNGIKNVTKSALPAITAVTAFLATSLVVLKHTTMTTLDFGE